MKRKVSELEGAELDYWVAKAEGLLVHPGRSRYIVADRIDTVYADEMAYSRLWAHGGPIIEREKICLVYNSRWEAGKNIEAYVKTMDATTS